jgi:membrane protease YdiL (CAAX protease family)
VRADTSPAIERAAISAAAAGTLPGRSPGEKNRLLAEFVGLFILIPTIPVVGLLPVTIVPFLVAVGLLVLGVLLYDPAFDRRRLGLGPPSAERSHTRSAVRRIALWFMLGAAGLATSVILFDPGSLFSLIRSRPQLWALIMIGYPILSVYPQEMIFRAFLFHRYSAVFRTRWATVAASAIAFGYAHIVLGNVVAIGLSLAGGLIFAYTYDRTKSTLLCAMEHGLYGCFIFTIGLGSHFHYGSMRAAGAAASAGAF